MGVVGCGDDVDVFGVVVSGGYGVVVVVWVSFRFDYDVIFVVDGDGVGVVGVMW